MLIHNAGHVRYGSLDEISYEDFKAVVDVHLMGAFNVVRPAFPTTGTAGYGRIVLTGSIGGIYGTNNVVNYGVSKTGMIGLNVIAVEGIRRKPRPHSSSISDRRAMSSSVRHPAHSRSHLPAGTDHSRLPGHR